MRQIIICLAVTSFLGSFALSQTRFSLTVGSKAPAISPYKWIKGKVSRFTKEKVYLIEFGATWCKPCRESIPHLSALQRRFNNALTVVSLFVQEPRKSNSDFSYVENVRKFIKDQGDIINYVTAVDDPKGSLNETWLKAASLEGIPQAFIVDKSGKIAWIGNPNYPNLTDVIQEILSPSYSMDSAIKAYRQALALKQPILDNDQPLFINNSGLDDQFLFRSLLMMYSGEKASNIEFVFGAQTSKIAFSKQSKRFRAPGLVQQIGVPIDKLYYMAYGDTIGQMFHSRLIGTDEYPDTASYPLTKDCYGKFWYKAILEIKDTTPFQFNYRFPFNRYNYSLLVPEYKATAAFMQEAMRRDLANYFGYDVRVEERMMPCWKLVASSAAKKQLPTKTPGQKYRGELVGDTLVHQKNNIMKDILAHFMYAFNSYCSSSYRTIVPIEEAPFVDETGIAGEIDYDYLLSDIKALNNGDWSAGLRFLHMNGLDLVKGQKLMKVVVIRDPSNKQ